MVYNMSFLISIIRISVYFGLIAFIVFICGITGKLLSQTKKVRADDVFDFCGCS